MASTALAIVPNAAAADGGADARIARRRATRARRVNDNVKAVREQVFRQRIDYHWLPDKRLEAVLTITLPDGNQFRFTAQCDPKEIARGLAALHPEIGGFSLGKLWKGIKKVAKGVVTSKVFKMAGSALAMAAPVLGPLAPAALGAAAAMKAGTALLAAKHHAKKGNKAGAAKLVKYAATATKVVDRTMKIKTKNNNMPPSAALLDAANHTANKVYTLLLKPA